MSTIKVEPVRSTWSTPTFTKSQNIYPSNSTGEPFVNEEICYITLLLLSMSLFLASFILKRKP